MFLISQATPLLLANNDTHFFYKRQLGHNEFFLWVSRSNYFFVKLHGKLFSHNRFHLQCKCNFYNAAPELLPLFQYGSALNGYLVEHASGTPFDDYCDNNLFQSTCMEKTAWHFSDFDSSEVARPYSYQNGNYIL